MTEPREEIEAALDVAVDRVRTAEKRFLEEPLGTDESRDAAQDVEQRAEDVEELATTARDRSDDLD